MQTATSSSLMTPAPAALSALLRAGRLSRRLGQPLGMPLPLGLRCRMEAFFGTDLSHVRIHADAGETATLGVQAFATGCDIYFAPGAFDPFSHAGLQRLGHEVTHVLQQQCGRVLASRPSRANTFTPVVLNNRLLEAEADLMGACMADALSGGDAVMRVQADGSFYIDHRHSGVAFDDFALFKRWAACHDADAGGVIQRVVTMPKWWSAPDAAKVEKWVEGKKLVVPGMLALYHGTNSGFRDKVTDFKGTEQQWVTDFFQRKQGGTTHCGPGIYGGDSLAVAQGYAPHVMVATNTELAKSRLIEATGTGVYKQDKGSTLPKISAQQLYSYGYGCIVHYTQNYYAVKDHKVQWAVQD